MNMELSNIQMDNIRAMVFDSGLEKEDLIRLLYDIAEEVNPNDGEMILELANIIEE